MKPKLNDVLIAILFLSWPCWAQTSSKSPDFSQVNDILNGTRTLLTTDDLVVGGVLLKTSNSKVEASGVSSLGTAIVKPGFGEILAHMFDGPSDTLVYTTTGRVIALDPLSKKTVSVTAGDINGTVQPTSKGDLTGDGFDDVVVSSFSGQRVVSAVDPHDFSKGIRITSDAGTGKYGRGGAVVTPSAVGDFLGNGRSEIAQVAETKGKTIVIYKVDPVTLNLNEAGSFSLSGGRQAEKDTIAVGRFTTTTHDQIMLGGILSDSYRKSSQGELNTIDFENSLNPVLKDTLKLPIYDLKKGQIRLAAGRFNAEALTDQVLMLLNNGQPKPANSYFTVTILTFLDGLKILNPVATVLPGVPCSSGLAVGNYDRYANGRRSNSLQFAITSSDCGNPPAKFNVLIYNVDAVSNSSGTIFKVISAPVSTYSVANTGDTQYYGLPLVAGDLQGRSVVVGDPLKVVVNSDIRPDIVLSLPPMHVDFVAPYRADVFSDCKTATDPCQVNISAFPGAFRTQLSSSQTTENNAVRKSTSSYSWGIGGSAGTTFMLGDVTASYLSASVKYAGAKSYDEDISKAYKNYGSTVDSINSTTGFADHVFFSIQRFNVWMYPVLGQKVCPANQATCPDDQKQQLYIEYSGPDDIRLHDADATNEDWYQPLDEPGNIFSYPWSYELFKQDRPEAALVTNEPRWRQIDTSDSSYSTTWSGGTGQDISVGAKDAHTNSVDTTSAGAIGLTGVFQISLNTSLNWNDSTAVSTLNDSTVSLSGSRGIQVDKPAFSSTIASQYQYSFAGFVYSVEPSNPSPQNLVVNDPKGQPAAYQTKGPLISAFLADLNPSVNARIAPFWTDVYKQPDIALNHPARWDWNKATNEVRFNKLTSGDPINQEFYWMKGLYITPENAKGKGPQSQTARPGDRLRLAARIYNYSLASVPAGSEVRVRFYGQVFDKSTNGLTGKAFQIDEVSLPPIPGFQANNLEPNWKMARTVLDLNKFEQTKSGDVFLVFWVVAWYQDKAGRLGPELSNHGLGVIPANLAEPTQLNVQPYSNNIGLYGAHTPLYIYPAKSGSSVSETAAVSESVAASETANVTLDSVSGPTEPIAVNQKAVISATLRNLDSGVGTQVIAFYDNDPATGDAPFDVQEVPAIPGNSTYVVTTSYHPRASGTHTFYVSSDPDLGNPVTLSYSMKVEP